MDGFEPRNFDLKVKSIKKTEKHTDKLDTTTYVLKARSRDGLNEFTIESAQPFQGIQAKTGVINVKVTVSQTPLSFFVKEKKAGLPKIKGADKKD